MDGSPPRAWRRRCSAERRAARVRFTSTRVETTFHRLPSVEPIHGSPPRAWRRRLRGNHLGRGVRFTSTRVEKTGAKPGREPQRRFTSTRVETTIIAALEAGRAPGLCERARL